MSRFTSHRSWAALLGIAAGVTASAMAGSAAHASAIASDNASGLNSTSGAALTTGATGGYGFGAWTLVGGNSAGPYAGEYADTSSKGVASSNGNSWGVYANSGTATSTPRIDLFRPFNAALASGQTFSVALESDSVGSDVYGTPPTYHSNGLPAIGFSLQSGSSTTVSSGTTAMTVGTASYNAGSYTNPNALFTVSFTELGPTETLNGQTNSGGYALQTNITDANGTSSVLSSGSNAINEAQLSAGITAAFALGNAGAYTLTLSSVGATPAVLATYTGTVSGTINSADLFDQATAQNGYFNNLSIANTAVPEPATIGLFIAAGAGLLLVRRRRMA